MDNSTLYDVIEKAKKLDETALSELYRYYQPKVLKFIYYRVGAERAEDLTSDVFVKVIRSIARQSGNFEAWLYKIARNIIIDNSRYRGSRPETTVEQEYLNQMHDSRNDHSRIDAEMDISALLPKLKDDYREFLVLKFIQGLSNKEISEITGKTVGALRVLQFRALKELNGVYHA